MMFQPTRFGSYEQNSMVAQRMNSLGLSNLPQHEARIFAKALVGDLDYSEVKTSSDAEWAANGYRERAKDESLSLEERRFANEFIANLDCDFGGAA